MPHPPLIHTERLTLTWPSPDQIRGYFSSIQGTRIFDTLLWDGPTDAQELLDWWKQAMQNHPSDLELSLDTAVIERASGRCIGGISLRPVDRDPRVVDIGYAFAVDAHGKGYATEAVGALVNEAFLNRDAERIFGNAFVGNHASRRVLEKLGFVLEGTQRRSVCKRGTWLDQWMIAITRPDWEQRHIALHRDSAALA